MFQYVINKMINLLVYWATLRYIHRVSFYNEGCDYPQQNKTSDR